MEQKRKKRERKKKNEMEGNGAGNKKCRNLALMVSAGQSWKGDNGCKDLTTSFWDCLVELLAGNVWSLFCQTLEAANYSRIVAH